jgi:hypothetical protein
MAAEQLTLAVRAAATEELGTKDERRLTGSLPSREASEGEARKRKAARAKEWRERNPERFHAAKKACYERKKEAYEAVRKAWLEKNREHHLSWRRQRYAGRVASDPAFKIEQRLRSSLYGFMRRKRSYRPASVMALVGCTHAELRAHIEAQFTDGMSWDNHGAWEVDHIRPLCSFDLLKEDERKAAFFYKNLQPLWRLDNLSKGKRTPAP